MKNKRKEKLKKLKQKYPERDWLNPKVEFRPSIIHGKGMFAKKSIKKGEAVFLWGGPYIKKREAEEARASGKLVFQVDQNVFTVEDRGKEITYFINHSCDPNLWMEDAVTFVAREDIEKDEELTVDISVFESEDYISKWECRCGSPLCRKKITGKDWWLPELQKRYKGHFSPLINKKIEKLNHRRSRSKTPLHQT